MAEELFDVKNRILRKYNGTQEKVIIPEGIKTIGNYAFENCSSVKELIVPEGVTRLSTYSFVNCTGLTRVELPQSIEEIGGFYGCQALTTVIMPQKAIKICGSAFFNCISLESIVIPEGITELGNGAFERCTGLKKVVLPQSMEKIGEFNGCCSLESIQIPQNVKEIKSSAFKNCSRLKNVTIPEGVISIGSYAFQGCERLDNLHIPDSVKTIENGAFYGCSNLKKIHMPKKCHVAKNAFTGCNSLESINDGRIISADWARKKKKEKSIDIPDGYTTISAGAFCVSWGELFSVEKLHLPDSLEKIEEEAFCNCKGLEDIHIPQKVKKIGKNAFLNCISLKTITVAEDNKYYDSRENCNAIIKTSSDTLVLACPNTVIPPSVKNIGGRAFSNVDQEYTRQGSVVYVHIPSTVEKLAQDAFRGTTAHVAVHKVGFLWLVPHPIWLGDFECIAKESQKVRSDAIDGFFYALKNDITEINEYKDGYVKYIKDHIKTYTKKIGKNEKLLGFFIEEKLLPCNEVDSFINKFSNNPELVARLLDYKQSEEKKGRSRGLSLEDNDKELLRRIRMEERKNQIKDQKGLSGKNFVATGEFEFFGEYDEYTGARDLSDLKRFIEERGGSLKSSVSSKTDYLISSVPLKDIKESNYTIKIKKALELGVTIISEEEFIEMAKEDGEVHLESRYYDF